MRNKNLEAQISREGLTKAATARKLGVHIRTLQRYCESAETTPLWVGLAVQGLRWQRELAERSRAILRS